MGLFALGCDSDSPTEPRSAPDRFPLARQTTHFVLRYAATEAPLVDSYAAALEESWPRVTTELGQASLPRIEGFLHHDQSSFTSTTGYDATGSVAGPDTFHMVAVPFAPQIAVHEFAHNVTLHLAPGAGNNPVWLWEAVAVYEARQFVAPSSLPAFAAGEFPTLAELNVRGGRFSIYDVGYVLAEFVVDRWGLAGLQALLLASGDTTRALGASAAAFEEEWRSFVRRRYLGPVSRFPYFI